MLLLLLAACAPFAPESSASLARHGATPDMVLTGPNLGWGMAAGDFNGDGIQDLVATSDDTGVSEMHIWYGQPDATLLAGPVIGLPFQIRRTPPGHDDDYYKPKLTSIDFQPDGFDDIVLGGRVWFGSTNGFTPAGTAYVGGTYNVGDPSYGGNRDQVGWKTLGFSLVNKTKADPGPGYDGMKALQQLRCGGGKGC